MVLIGGNDEKEIFTKLKYTSVVFDLIGKTNYSDLASLSAGASLIIGNDTGPMHLLVVCSNKKAKKIVLFGQASDPNLCAPRGDNVIIIRKNNINDISPKKVITLINKNNYSKLT